MYVPAPFRESDPEVAFDLIARYGFATLVSWTGAEPIVSHLPLLLERTAPGGASLLGHVARANPHWRRFGDGESALAIFRGPHAYVSPSWYASRPSVPTWNYAVVHVHGAPEVVGDDETRDIARRLVAQHEGAPIDLPPDFVADELRAIVGFRMPVARLEAKFKLNQNRDAVDRAGATVALEASDDPRSRELGAFMRAYLGRDGEEGRR